MTTTMLRFLLAASTLSDDELATMLEIAVEDEKDDIRHVEDDVKSQPADIPIDQLESIKLRVAMARKLLPAWSA